MRPRRLSFRRAAVLLALAAGLHGLVYVPLVSTNEKTDTWPYVASANAILDGTYTTPLRATFVYVHPNWYDITGARIPERAWDAPERQVFRPPGYPAYVALFGEGDVFAGDHTLVLLGHGGLFALGAYLLILTVRRWWDENVALLAGVLYAVDPWSKHYVALLLSEALATTVLLAGIYAFTRAWETRAVSWWAATGALFGALALVRAVFVLAVPLVVLFVLVRSDLWRPRLLRAGTVAVAAGVLLVPWLAWVHGVVGRTTMSVWGQGYNLVLAAYGEGHGRTAGDVEEDPEFRALMDRVRAGVPGADELLADPTAHPRYLSRADEHVREEAKARYGERLRSEPAQVVWDAAYRMWFLWTAHKDWYQPEGLGLVALRALDWLTLALALAGSAVALARGGVPRAVLALIAAYTIALGVHHVEARFGMPFRGVVLALVALALVDAARPFRERGRGAYAPARK